ncbi:MAG TPA: hypothetical protein VFQ61_37055, partial [Polyangiaceae bacterium]|nr:hypothetical protein [Polyangiaceae bacterium]
MSISSCSPIELTPAQPVDFESLCTLRLDAMRESLERIGRFDVQRARDRFRATFTPEATRNIVSNGVRVGFVGARFVDDAIALDHLYVHPSSAATRGQPDFVTGDAFSKIKDSRGNRWSIFYLCAT